MLHGSYFADKLGVDIRDWMFKRVHQEDPDSRLFVNDFDVLANGIYTQVFVNYLSARGRVAPTDDRAISPLRGATLEHFWKTKPFKIQNNKYTQETATRDGCGTNNYINQRRNIPEL